MALPAIITIIIVTLTASSAKASLTGEQKIKQLLELIKIQNLSVQAANQSHTATKHMEHGAGYLPDPTVKLNVFGSPIKTRNGPQKSNIMVTQLIPWPSALRAEEQLAASMAMLKQEQVDILLLDLNYKAKTLIYKYVELSEKLANKSRMILILNNLNKVVLGRLKLGEASQAEISRINIEIARLTQSVRRIEAKMMNLHQQLKAMVGGKNVAHLLPTTFDPRWVQLGYFQPNQVDVTTHPLLKLAKAKIDSAQAGIEQAAAKRLPKIGASVSWYQIAEPSSAMANSDSGKDAWAIGASVSIPIWSRKYDSLEHSQFAKRSAAQSELHQREIDLRAGIKSVYEEFQSEKDIHAIFRTDILPQAGQTLKTDRDSYAQGKVPFERVIENYIRVIRFKDQLIESQIKQATLKAALEKLVGRSM